MHSSTSRSGRITIRLLKKRPINKFAAICIGAIGKQRSLGSKILSHWQFGLAGRPYLRSVRFVRMPTNKQRQGRRHDGVAFNSSTSTACSVTDRGALMAEFTVDGIEYDQENAGSHAAHVVRRLAL